MTEIKYNCLKNITTLPESDYQSDVFANKGLVYLLAGVKTRWKLPVGYDLSSHSFNAKFVKDRILTIIREARKRGIKISAIVSDMGGSNRPL